MQYFTPPQPSLRRAVGVCRSSECAFYAFFVERKHRGIQNIHVLSYFHSDDCGPLRMFAFFLTCYKYEMQNVQITIE